MRRDLHIDALLVPLTVINQTIFFSRTQTKNNRRKGMKGVATDTARLRGPDCLCSLLTTRRGLTKFPRVDRTRF